MFNLTADQINSLSYGSVSADTFTSKPVARGLVFTKPIGRFVYPSTSRVYGIFSNTSTPVLCLAIAGTVFA